MAKFKSNHQHSRRPFAGLALRVFMMLAILAVLFVMLMRMLDGLQDEPTHGHNAQDSEEAVQGSSASHEVLIPGNNQAEIVHHQYYSLGYNETYEQAAWVSYLLTRDLLKVPNVQRSDRFEVDPKISTRSADYYDYRGSGYSRGHLAPAGDMAQNNIAMRESFFMSNISPQKIHFNGGIWRELEECVRDWAYKEEQLYIVTGPILNNVTEYIGRNTKVGVPQAYYKIVLDAQGADAKAIAFIMPNERSDRPIMEYAVTVDEVEKRTGLDFFAHLLSEEEEELLESTIQPHLWPVSEKRYQKRRNSWNNQ